MLDAVTRLRLSEPGALAQADEAERRSELDALLASLEGLLRETALSVARHYFTDVRGPQQLVAMGQEGPE